MNNGFVGILFIALLIAATVVPVMVAARWLRAERSGIFAVLFAIILHQMIMVGIAVIVLQVAPHVSPQWRVVAALGAVWVVDLVGGGMVFSFVLGTTFWRGMCIGIFSWFAAQVLDRFS